jgi:hypothetical protein
MEGQEKTINSTDIKLLSLWLTSGKANCPSLFGSTPVTGRSPRHSTARRGAGFGFYTAIDKYRPAPGRHVSDVVSLTLSLRPTNNFDVRVLWHHMVTDYNRDADILLFGLGYRF